MEKIYSKIEENKLLHIINRLDEIEGRHEVVPEDNFIQCATLKMANGKTFPPHKHITKDRHYTEQIAQESWVVIKGSVECHFYDTDGELLGKPVLNVGDCSITLGGGHNYLILEHGTLVYEYKTGPYKGQKLDKVFLDEL